ncbi:MAG: hypothetical protein H0T53_03780 [Herpetosiphonaceae bacterium]|nr:hypothetical protein [Herpetosiphonaceae bacterium]
MTTQPPPYHALDLPALQTPWQTFSQRIQATVQATLAHPDFGELQAASPQEFADAKILHPFIQTAILEPMRWLMPSAHSRVIRLLQLDASHSSLGNNLGTRFAHSMTPLLLNPLMPHFGAVALPFAALLNLCGIEKASDDLHILGFEMRHGEQCDQQRIVTPYRAVLAPFLTLVLEVIDGAYPDLNTVARHVRRWDVPLIDSPITTTLQALLALLPAEELSPSERWWVEHPLHTTLMLNLVAVALVVESSASFPEPVRTLVLEALRQRYTGVQAQLANPSMALGDALAVGADTILVKCVFAVLLGCVVLAQPDQHRAIERHWAALLQAINTGAGLIRLANDLGALTIAHPTLKTTLQNIQPGHAAMFPYAMFATLRPHIRQHAESSFELLLDRLLRDGEGREYNIGLCASANEWSCPGQMWHTF